MAVTTADARAAESECAIVVKRPYLKRSLALLLGNPSLPDLLLTQASGQPARLGRAAEASWLTIGRRRAIARRQSPGQWPLTGKFKGDIDRRELADLRRIRCANRGRLPPAGLDQTPVDLRADFEAPCTNYSAPGARCVVLDVGAKVPVASAAFS